MKRWLKFLGGIGGALIGQRVACEVVFFNLAVPAYENSLERAIKATLLCHDADYVFGFSCFIAGALAGYVAERHGHPVIGFFLGLIAGALAGVLSGLAYYVYWFRLR